MTAGRRSRVGWLLGAGVLIVVLSLLFLWRSSGPLPRTVRGATSGGGSPAPAPGRVSEDDPRGGEAQEGSSSVSCSIEGSVVDDEGRVVSGATVSARPHAPRPFMRFVEPQDATTDDEGRFGLGPVSCGTFLVAANAAGLVTSQAERVETTEAAPRADVHLVLGREGYRVYGVVADQGGGGIPGATVRAVQMPAAGAHVTAGDEQGRYELWLGAGNYGLEASAFSYAPVRRRVTVNRDREVGFELDPGGTIRGRVLVQATREPVPAASVSASRGWRPWSSPTTTTSASDGTFDLTGLASGEYDVAATKGDLRGQHPGRVPVGVASYVTEVIVEVRTGLAIRGRVVDENGGSIAEASVDWMVFPQAQVQGRSRSDGTFELLGLRPGKGVLAVNCEGYAPGHVELALADRDEDGVEVVLAAGVRVRGAVVDSEHRPIAGATVTGMPEGRGGFGPRRWLGAAFDYTDRRGRFLLDGLVPGDLVVRAQHLEHGSAATTLEDLEPGREYEVELVMQLGAAVSGRVIWEDGEAAAGATVHAFSRGLGPMGAAETEADEVGAYKLAGLEPRGYQIWAQRPGVDAPMPFPSPDNAPRELELEASQELSGIDFVLARADLQITGMVVDEGGAPVADAEVGAEVEAGLLDRFRFRGRLHGVTARSDGDGRFTITGLTVGSYEVWAEVPGFPRGSTRGVDAGAGDVTVTIPPGAILTGVVVGAGGEPASPYELRTVPLRERAGWLRWHGAERLAVEAESGVFEVRGLGAGSYRLLATTPAGLVGELPVVEVVTGERKDGLKIVLAGGAELTASLRGHASGAPVRGVTVLVHTDAGHESVTTDDNGELTVKGLAIGQAAIMVRPEDETYVPDHFVVAIEPGENSVALRLVEVAALPAGEATPPVRLIPAGTRIVVEVLDPNAAGSTADGDQLASIDDHPVAGLGIRGAEALLRGPAGVVVELGLVSATTGLPFVVSVARAEAEAKGAGSGAQP